MAELKFPTLEEFGMQAGEWALDEFEYKGHTIREWADKITSGEYQPVKHAWWNGVGKVFSDEWTCSNCGHKKGQGSGIDFCGNCGAKMDLNDGESEYLEG